MPFFTNLGNRFSSMWGSAAGFARHNYYSTVNFGREASVGYRSGMDALANTVWHQMNVGARVAGIPGAFRGFGRGLGMLFYENIRRQPNRAADVGYIGALASPLLAGAAVYSGIANIRRGRYGRAIAGMAAGAALTALMYSGAMANIREEALRQRWNDYEAMRMQADYEV